MAFLLSKIAAGIVLFPINITRLGYLGIFQLFEGFFVGIIDYVVPVVEEIWFSLFLFSVKALQMIEKIKEGKSEGL